MFWFIVGNSVNLSPVIAENTCVPLLNVYCSVPYFFIDSSLNSRSLTSLPFTNLTGGAES